MTSLVSGGVGCGVASYEDDLSVSCPFGLVQKEGKVVGCKRACLALASKSVIANLYLKL